MTGIVLILVPFAAGIIFVIVRGLFYGVSTAIRDSRTEKQLQIEHQQRLMHHCGYDGVYLKASQIRALESHQLLPHLPASAVPLVLTNGEIVVFRAEAIWARNYSIDGDLIITTKRVAFTSDENGFDIPLQKISVFSYNTDGITIQSGNRVIKLELSAAYLAKLVFDGIINGNMPISQKIMYDDPYSDVDISDEDDEETTEEDSPSNICRDCDKTRSLLDEMDGHQFEHYCAELLRKNGFLNVEVTRGSGDQGVDIIASKDGIRYAIQCKKYASPLSNTPVQEVKAGCDYYNCHVGVVLTNSTFTRGAISLAEATRVLLWDQAKLQELIDNAGGGKALGDVEKNIEEFKEETEVCSITELDDADIIYIDDEFDSVRDLRDDKKTKDTYVLTEEPLKKERRHRPILLVVSILSFIMTVIGLCLTIEEVLISTTPTSMAGTLFYLIWACMFYVLARSPKYSPYILGKAKGIKKGWFVLICSILAWTALIGLG